MKSKGGVVPKPEAGVRLNSQLKKGGYPWTLDSAFRRNDDFLRKSSCSSPRRSPGSSPPRYFQRAANRRVHASLLIWAGLALACTLVLHGENIFAEPPRLDRPAHPTLIEFPPLEFHPPSAERIELKNGMVVFLLPDSTVPMVRAFGMIQAGALCETAEEQGLADLTARVMRLGGTKIVSATELNERLEYVGASLETASDRDYAMISLRALSKDRDMVLELFADLLRNPAFPTDKLDQRRNEALEELRRQDDDPMEITRREFRRLLYGEHPYGRDPLGTPETLASFGRDNLQAWHARHFHPNRMILAVSGDFERAWFLSKLDLLLGDWPKAEGAFAPPPVEPQPTAGKRFFIEKDLNQSTIRMGHLGIRKDNLDAIALDVLNYILGGGGFSSRLVNKVRTEAGFAYLVASVFDEPLLTGQFLAVLQTQTKNSVAAARLTMDIIRDVAENDNLTDAEITLAKEARLNDFVFKFETPHDVARRYAEIEFYGLPSDYLETYRDRLAAVSREDLIRVAREYIKPSQMTVLILGREEVLPEFQGMGPVDKMESRGRKDADGH